MDSQTKAILWAAIKEQNELRKVAVDIGNFEIAEQADNELQRLADRLRDGISNSRFDNS